ncbi:DUF2301 domain-containing membrane protein [Roseofilum sp. BLCC_M154]|uniref:DUF2301 domain-containing membrane protein n=1 Tax=Roseofilum acuticapitatum BLCC-M154 TaxID=3022444 RepID=A0ABT7AZY0_9CYAN|nr:DUF2301 domain-containing membrane protein [Roseofilum acuticapitatum]MDJ1172430.1 DUF2301 domain-containing membrane protein [Roseofilum acuticapitatum BLCC-M154]
MTTSIEQPIYQGQFGSFTITPEDRQGVVIYRTGLTVAALSMAIATTLTLWPDRSPDLLSWLTPLYFLFCGALGVSLLTIHIYMVILHRALQLFLIVGSISGLILTFNSSQPLALTVYTQPLTLFGIGFTFVALTGIYFKEAFCFNRLETKFLTPLVPLLLLGVLFGTLPLPAQQIMLAAWSILFLIFAGRKLIQPIPPDIGDKSVFEYLKKGQGNG